jgi:outer membrane receptor protein involved in Fe transport
LAFTILVASSFATTGQDCIKGNIFDLNSKEPLAGAAIRIIGSSEGVYSIYDGSFRLCSTFVPPFTIVITHIGYERREVQVLNLDKQIDVSIKPTPYVIDQVVFTATLNNQSTLEVPASVSVIDSIIVQSSPATNIDNYLRTIPGLFVDRSSGVFSKNASVTMRGLDGANRVLILYDGTPLNKTSYGFINWSLISPDIVNQIEVVHGPSSALFGNNAMAGVINIRTKEPENNPFYGSVTAEAGGFGLIGVRSTLGGKTTILKQEVRVMANGFWRQGDGYIAEPLTFRDSTNVPLYLKEKGANLKVLIPITDSSSFYAGTNIYTDKRGAGRAVYLPDGSFDSYTTFRLHTGFRGIIGKTKVDVFGFFQRERYDRQNESINQTGDTYRIYHTDQLSGDMGIWVNASRQLTDQNRLMGGIDFKHGFMEAEDFYRTSTDYIRRDGKVSFGAMFLQDEQKLLNGKLRLLGGLRFDFAQFFDGILIVKEPTRSTGFSEEVNDAFPANSWYALNPKVGVRYSPTHWLSAYGSISSGFMPAKLDDLCSSRKVTKGFKLANPKLQPEHLVTYEVGANLIFGSKLRIDAAFFHSQGRDFHYFVATGDSVDTGGSDIKPIVKRENISSVQVFGGEFTLRYSPTRWLVSRATYSFNHSTIVNFKVNPLVNIDLTGNGLAEVPLNQASLEVFLMLPKVSNFGLVWSRIGPQWGDEINSYTIKPWNTFDLRLWREYKDVKVSMDIFDLFNMPYIDKKGLMSPGRYFMVSLGYRIN